MNLFLNLFSLSDGSVTLYHDAFIHPDLMSSLLREYHPVLPNGAMWVFAGFILLVCLVQCGLAYRQIRHVSVRRGAVPLGFASQISLEEHQKAADYTCAKAKFSMADHGVSAAFILWLTLGGAINWMVLNIAKPDSHSLFFVTLSLFVCVFMVSGLLSLLLDFYRVFYLESRFGFNRSTKKLWIIDQIRGGLLSFCIEFLLVLSSVFIVRALTDSWWLWLWLLLMVFNLLMTAIYPRFIAPLFNQFKPLEDAALGERIRDLFAKNQFAVEALFVMDGSKRSTHGNAYFSGFGSNKRIVLFDTLLETLSQDEIMAVLAHELGHLKKHHLWQNLVAFALLSFGLLFVLQTLSLNRLFYEALNLHWPLIPVTLLVFMQVLPFILFPLKPIWGLFSCKHEYEADQFAVSQTSRQDLISALIKLYGKNAATLTADPVYAAVYNSHPSATSRIKRLES